MLDNGVTEGTVFGHDAQLAAALFGVGREAVRGERLGDRVQRVSERPLDVCVASSELAITRPYSTPTSSAMRSACSRGSIASARPSNVTRTSSRRNGVSKVSAGGEPEPEPTTR